MLGLFKSKKSPIRQALESLFDVRDTWFEWTLEDEILRPILVVEYRYETDPGHVGFERGGLDEIRAIVSASEKPHPTVRIIPVRAWG